MSGKEGMMTKLKDELVKVIEEYLGDIYKARYLAKVISDHLSKEGWIKKGEIQKIADSLMYDFPKHYNNYHIMAYQQGIKKLATVLALKSGELLKEERCG